MTALDAPPRVQQLLDRLHAQSLEQEQHLDKEEAAKIGHKAYMSDKFIALEADKCVYTYQLIRALKPKNVLELGTSYGVSTIYLALAVYQNDNGGKVIATEYEPEKAARARMHWDEAGQKIASVIDLKEGDFHQTLTQNLPEIDFVLFDIWAPVALDALRIIEPHLKSGTLMLVDNVERAADTYRDFIEYLDASPRFRRLNVPFAGGLNQVLFV